MWRGSAKDWRCLLPSTGLSTSSVQKIWTGTSWQIWKVVYDKESEQCDSVLRPLCSKTSGVNASTRIIYSDMKQSLFTTHEVQKHLFISGKAVISFSRILRKHLFSFSFKNRKMVYFSKKSEDVFVLLSLKHCSSVSANKYQMHLYSLNCTDSHFVWPIHLVWLIWNSSLSCYWVRVYEFVSHWLSLTVRDDWNRATQNVNKKEQGIHGGIRVGHAHEHVTGDE